MGLSMRKVSIILILLSIILSVWLAALWLSPTDNNDDILKETRYGINEALELVEQTKTSGRVDYIVEDAEGNNLFAIPLRNCLLDTRYRNGKLKFRERTSLREGYIDRQGLVIFTNNTPQAIANLPQDVKPTEEIRNTTINTPQKAATASGKGYKLPTHTNLQELAKDNPFYREAAKVIQGKYTESDAANRKMILNYCEHFRTAYTTKDIDFLRQVFSNNALIIVGNIVKPTTNDDKYQSGDAKVTMAIHSKHDYLSRLSKVFVTNKKIDVRFSDFKIMRHPTKEGIYGVMLRQQYSSDKYSDDGYLFLLWDFTNKSMPLIHVRTWQPKKSVNSDSELIGISDFNLN